MANVIFKIGNTLTGSTVTQVGEMGYTAKIVLDHEDIITGDITSTDYKITAGVGVSIAVDENCGVRIVATPNAGNSFSEFTTNKLKPLPFTPSLIDHVLSYYLPEPPEEYTNLIIKLDGREPQPHHYTTGNVLDSFGDAILEGEAKYTAKIVAVTEDPSTGDWTNTEYPFTVGVPLVCDLIREDTVTFEALANEGVNFTSASVDGVAIEYKAKTIKHTITREMILAGNNKKRAFLIGVGGDEPVPVPTDSFINLYNPNQAEYSELQDLAFNVYNPVAPNVKPWEFISAAIQIPFKLPDSVLGLKENIKAGQWTFNLMNRVLDPIFKVDLGSIEVPATHNNSLDYDGVEVTLVVPYMAESVNLEPQQVIGKKIDLEYVVVGTNGGATLNVYCDSILIASNQANIGVDVPFYSFYNQVSKSFTPATINNRVFTAYILINAPEHTSTITPRVTVEGNLNNLIGEVRIIESNITGIPNQNEYVELISILNSGIYIK